MWEQIDLKICRAIYSVIRSLFKYLVINVDDPIFKQENYKQFFKSSIRHFEEVFSKKKYLMGNCVKILKAKQKKDIDAGEWNDTFKLLPVT